MAAAAAALPPAERAAGECKPSICGGDLSEPAPSTAAPDDESEASGTGNSIGEGTLGRLLAVFGAPLSQSAALSPTAASAAPAAPTALPPCALAGAAAGSATVPRSVPNAVAGARLLAAVRAVPPRPFEEEGVLPPVIGAERSRCGKQGPRYKAEEGGASCSGGPDGGLARQGVSSAAQGGYQCSLGGLTGRQGVSCRFSSSSSREAGDEASNGAPEDRGRELLRLLRTGAPCGPNPRPPAVPSACEPPSPSGELLRLVRGGASPDGRPEAGPENACCLSDGLLPMSLNVEPWENLVRPIVDDSDPKAFVGAEVFCRKGGGITVVEGEPRPQVLVDRRERGILVMFKPSGWATCSTPHWEGNEGNLIRHVWRHLNAPTAAPCHRLDKGTSGIVVVAMSKVASKHICRQISQKKLVKQYLGLCHGHVAPAAGAMSAPLALSSTDKPLGTCSREGREAVTRYRVVGYFGRDPDRHYSLVQVQIDHGRQHQIRLHMASLGHPLVSDPKYNSSFLREDAEISPRLFLHACFLRCVLPPGELGASAREREDFHGEPFHVACRLPPDLKTALLSVLTWRRDLDEQLLPEAARVCECLLAPGEADSLHASRLVVRRRDDFLHRFGFNGQERAEVTRILSMLPTAKERSAALHQFRVLGQRTPDFIVERFAKYVEGLLRWRKSLDGQEAMQDDNFLVEILGSEAAENTLATDLSASASAGATDPVRQISGPFRIHSEFVWCDVCGMEERQVYLETPTLLLRVLVPPQQLSSPCYAAMAQASSEEAAAGSPFCGGEALRGQKELELQQVVRDFVRESGGAVDGIWVASKIASRFNQWLRTNSKRNDGSLRRWVGTIPGISVEHRGTNKWRVHCVQ